MTSHSNIMVGVIVSLIIHAVVFIQYKTDFSFKKLDAPAPGLSHQMQIELVKYVKPIQPLVTKAKIRKNNPKKVISEKSSPKKIIQSSHPSPVKSYQTPLEPIDVENEIAQKKMVDKEIPVETVADKQKAETQTLASQALSDQQRKAEQQKENERKAYLSRLLAHIEAFKFYPSAARRRAIEGKLEVTFLLRDGGDYDQLSINGGKAVLQRAVRQALVDAQPFPEPPTSMQINQRIAFSMNYQLE